MTTSNQSLPWHQSQWALMSQAVLQGKLAHAYLFQGPSGLGKMHFASQLANNLLCTNPVEQAACGICRGCLLSYSENHPDLMRVVPEKENQPVIRIDQIRKANDFVLRTAQQDGYRILIIDQADCMNVYAANALLKILEEPGANVLIVLLSAHIDGVLPTLRSRCQRIVFCVPDQKQSLPWLSAELATVDVEKRKKLLSMAKGRPLLALNLYKNQSDQIYFRLIEDLKKLSKGEKTPVAISLEYADCNIIQLQEWLLQWLRETIRYAMSDREDFISLPENLPMLKYIGKKVLPEQLINYYNWLVEQRRICMTHVGINQQLVLDELFIRWLHLTLSKPSIGG